MKGQTILKKIINALNSALCVFAHSTLFLSRRTDRRIYLEMDPSVHVRTCRELLILFELAGYQVDIRARWRKWTLSVARALAWHRNAKLVWQSPFRSAPRIVCTDQRERTKFESAAEKVIHLSYDYKPGLAPGVGQFAMPIPMHCQIYTQYGEHGRLDVRRRAGRKLRIAFAGNWDEKGYNNPIFRDLYGMLNRFEIVRFLQSRKDTHTVRSLEELRALLSAGYSAGLVLVDSQLRINQEHWMDFLSQTDFFLCPPGILFPWSHNAVEAMAVGTVPLINYPDWFYPSLRHSDNCLTFSTLEGLTASLDRILGMDADDVRRLRQSVVHFYSENLDPACFVERIMACPKKHVYLHAWDEKESVMRRLLQRRSAATV